MGCFIGWSEMASLITATFQQKPKEMRGIQRLWVKTVAMTKGTGLESQSCVLMGTVLSHVSPEWNNSKLSMVLIGYNSLCVKVPVPSKNAFDSHSVMSSSLQDNGLYSPWNSPGQNTRVGSLSLLQRIFPAQGSNPGLLHCRPILYRLSHQGSPKYL